MTETTDEALVVNGNPVAVIEWTVGDYRAWYKELIARDVAETKRQQTAKAAAQAFAETGEFPDSEAFGVLVI